MEFNYFYGTEADQFSFIRIPKVLLTGEDFSGLSLQAKVLYGLLLDRMGLSVKNRWLDDNDRVFIIYQIAEIQEDLGFSKKKAMEFLNELEAIGLVEKKKRGFGLPSILYVKNFITQESGTSRGVDLGTSGDAENEPEIDEEEENIEENSLETGNSEVISFRSAQMGSSRGVDLGTSGSAEMGTSGGASLGATEVPEWEPLNNNTKYINNYINNTKSNLIESGEDETEIWNAYKQQVRENLELDIMLGRYPFEQEMINGIYDLVIEVLVSKNSSIIVSGDRYPAELVKAKMLRLNSSHLEYVLDRLATNTTRVRNIKKYVLATLFNAPTTISSYYRAEVNADMPQLALAKTGGR
ncbi:MAG: replication initiator protein A [Pseudobutyrivibrio sp.]|nr:replication initiator protein A [Pseudobutyrivibrio sp.]MCF0186839.1 replication initiator protein A [Bacteroidaceae bacterium]